MADPRKPTFAAPPERPRLVPRKAQEQDYIARRDRDFCTLHEELTALRKTAKDLERTIALLRAENQRLLAELLEKGKELQWLKDILQAHGIPLEDVVTGVKKQGDVEEELRHRLAERDETIEAMKKDIVTARSSQQSALEEAEQLNKELNDLKRQAGLGSEHEKSMARMAKEFQAKAAECEHFSAAAQEASNRNLQLTSELRMAETRIAELLSQATSNQRRACELQENVDALVAAQKTKEEEVSALRVLESENQGEIRRLNSILVEFEDIKLQVQAFKAARDGQEKQQAEVAKKYEDEIQKLREERRSLFREVEKHKDDVARLELELQRKSREHSNAFEGAKDAAAIEFHQKEMDLTAALSEAMREKVIREQEAAQLQQKLERLEAHHADSDATQATLRDALSAATQKCDAAENKLSSAVVELDALRTKSSELEQIVLALRKENQELKDITDDAAGEMRVLEEQTALLRGAKKNEESELAVLQRKYAELEEQMKTDAHDLTKEVEKSQTQYEAIIAKLREDLQKAIDSNAAVAKEAEKQKDEAARQLAAHQTEAQAIRVENQSTLLQRDGELAALRKELEELKSTQGLRETELRVAREAASKAVGEARAAKERDVSKALSDAESQFDAERKELQGKLKLSEAQRRELEVSLDLKAKSLITEAEARRRSAKEHEAQLHAAGEKLKTFQAQSRSEVARITAQLEEQKQRNVKADETYRTLQARIAALEEENKGLKDMQLHW